MIRSRRGASPVPFVLFLLLWLVACFFTYQYIQDFDLAQKLLEKKKTSALRLGETVPDLKTRRDQLGEQIKDLKKLMGFLTEGGNLDATTVDQVVSLTLQKLKKYHDGIDDPSKSFISTTGGDKDTKIMINGQWILLPLIKDPAKPETLRDVRFKLNLESVVVVLRELVDRLEMHRREVENEIRQRKAEGTRIEEDKSSWIGTLTKQIGEQKSRKETFDREKTKIEGDFKAQIDASTGEKGTMEKSIQDLDKQVQREEQNGKKEVMSLNQKIKDANEAKAQKRRDYDKLLGRGVRPRGVNPGWDFIRDSVDNDLPDGEVIRSEAGADPYIGIGTHHKVVPGLKFFVVTEGPGGSWIYKAKIEVKRVEGDISQVRVIHQADAREPLTRGDKVFNKLFRTPDERNKRGPMRVVFLGKFQSFEPRMNYVKRQMQQMGVEVQKELTHWTDLVVVEREFDTDPQYKKATNDLQCEVITVDQLKEFLSY